MRTTNYYMTITARSVTKNTFWGHFLDSKPPSVYFKYIIPLTSPGYLFNLAILILDVWLGFEYPCNNESTTDKCNIKRL